MAEPTETDKAKARAIWSFGATLGLVDAIAVALAERREEGERKRDAEYRRAAGLGEDFDCSPESLVAHMRERIELATAQGREEGTQTERMGCWKLADAEYIWYVNRTGATACTNAVFAGRAVAAEAIRDAIAARGPMDPP